jgi:hypothetical protein
MEKLRSDKLRYCGIMIQKHVKGWLYRYPSISVADPGFLSRIDPIFSIPDPKFFHPGSRIRIKEFKYFNPKIVSKLFIPDPDPDFLPIPNSGSGGQKVTGSRIRIRNTA